MQVTVHRDLNNGSRATTHFVGTTSFETPQTRRAGMCIYDPAFRATPFKCHEATTTMSGNRRSEHSFFNREPTGQVQKAPILPSSTFLPSEKILPSFRKYNIRVYLFGASHPSLSSCIGGKMFDRCVHVHHKLFVKIHPKFPQ